MTKIIHTDAVIIGGGIAGLWLFRTLNLQGYRTVLLENQTLGGGQTVKSQGIIHGGTKYTLSGQLTGASQAIATMPDRWRRALAGEGELDLSSATILSPYHYLWSPGGLGSRLTSFFASKALRGRVDPLKPGQFPDIFNHPGFKGRVYQLNEIVLDITTVIRALVQGLENRVIQVDWDRDTRLVSDQGQIRHITIDQGGQSYQLQARRYITTAGEGTAGLMRQWGIEEPRMQLRPLHMVMVRHSHPQPIFAHCIGTRPVPRITITSHPDGKGQWVWYMGGEIAEEGNGRTGEEQIRVARKELSALLPWVNLAHSQWATLKVNRAEPRQSSLLRPDSAFCQEAGNGIVTWPTKLALAPNLSDEVLALLTRDQIQPSGNKDFQLPAGLAEAEITPPFWHHLDWVSHA